MRQIKREIVSAIIFSKDSKILMGRKDPYGGGVYPDAWHIPGGGVEEGETFEEALLREVKDETGIDISNQRVQEVPEKGDGVAEKTLSDTQERVVVRMRFNRYEVYLDQNSDEIDLNPNEDLVELKWFAPSEAKTVKHIPGGLEFFEQKGYVPKSE